MSSYMITRFVALSTGAIQMKSNVISWFAALHDNLARGYFFSCLAEHEIYHAHKCLNISMINTTSERLKARHFFICRYFSLYEQLKFRAQLS